MFLFEYHGTQVICNVNLKPTKDINMDSVFHFKGKALCNGEEMKIRIFNFLLNFLAFEIGSFVGVAKHFAEIFTAGFCRD